MKINNLTLEQLEEIRKDIDEEIAQTKRSVELKKCGGFDKNIAIWGPSFGADDLEEIADPLEINFLRWFLISKVNADIDLDQYCMIYKVSPNCIKEEHRDISVYGFFDVNPIAAPMGVNYPTCQISIKGREYLLEEYTKCKFT